VGKWNSKSGNFPAGYKPARLDRTVPFRFGRKFPEIYYREVLETEIVSNGTVISDQNHPTEKSGWARVEMSQLLQGLL